MSETSKDLKWREECAVFGVTGTNDAARFTALGLHAMQHRGQEACGIISVGEDPKLFTASRGIGLVGDVFGKEETILGLRGSAAIGHNRYSTTTADDIRSIQPLFAELGCGGVALAHNGNITNARTLRRELIKTGAIFQSYSDTEVIVQLMSRAQGTAKERLSTALKSTEGAYSLVLLSEHNLIAARDPRGIRPLQLGRVGDAYVIASESCAFDIMDGEFIRDLDAGEILEIEHSSQKITRHSLSDAKVPRSFCVFEYVYFSRPDSTIQGVDVYSARRSLGRRLAVEAPADSADIVIPIPDSGVPAALGFAEESKLPFEFGLIRNHYVGRTFIEPTEEIRHLGVKLKHNANRSLLKGKRVVLLDDSLVRGTTVKKIIQMVRQAGAIEVHVRISSPPTLFPCFYGVNTPTRAELLAPNNSEAEIAKLIGCDSLAYLSFTGMMRAVGADDAGSGFCAACFSGKYPTTLQDQSGELSEKRILRNKSG